MDLTVSNTYFPDGVCTAFGLYPFQATSRYMKNYQLRINQVRNTFSMYAGTPGNQSLNVPVDFKGLTDLYFQLTVDDALFFHYTNLPVLQENQYYFFRNGKNPSDPESLQQADFVTSEDLIAFKPKRFNILLPQSEVMLQIKKDDQEVVSATLDGNQIKNYLLNLSGYEDGVYQLWLNKTLQETFFMSDEAMRPDCIAIVRFNITEIAANYPGNLSFSIDFDARSVFWEYKVVVPPSRKIQVEAMKIAGPANEAYDGPQQAVLIGGQEASVFTTAEPLQLQRQLEESPLLSVTYSNDFSNRKKQMELKLPNPDVEQISKYNQGKNEGSFFASTIVYV